MSGAAPEPLGPGSPLSALAGIGPVRAADLAREGLGQIEDLLLRPPRRWEDRSRLPGVRALTGSAAGTRATILVEVERSRLIRTRRRGFTLFRARVGDGTDSIDVVWFNQPYLARQLIPGRRLFLHGDIKPCRGRGRPRQMENPEIEMIPEHSDTDETLHVGRIVPVYRRIGGLSPRLQRSLVHALLAGDMDIPDPVPPDILRSHRLPGRREALQAVHFPAPGTDLHRLAAGTTDAQRRMAYEELLLLSLACETRRAARASRQAPRITQRREDLAAGLPFRLTAGQGLALDTILADLACGSPMARLLQGDVGCGKTVVALLACAAAVHERRQAALMVPTEVLACQHFRTAQSLIGLGAAEFALLTGSTGAPERRRILRRLDSGDLPLVIGTHALLQEDVRFASLGLVVIDEQQRFGVGQRQQLVAKGAAPHVLVMTATPIPRTLALTAHGDLDLVEIRDLPPGRAGVRTEVHAATRSDAIWQRLREAVERGRQGYVIYPRIEATDASDLKALRRAAEELRSGPLDGLQVGVLHGRLPAAEKAAEMQRFASGRTSVLLSTTVVEVGMDVADATFMVVEHAERFGLAQLHQLRGRIGRGTLPATCILLAGDSENTDARARLEILAATSDGFAVAETDLALRGAGEMTGTRQSGETGVRFADLARDTDLIDAARKDAAELMRAGPPKAMLDAARRRWGERFAAESG